MSDPWDIPEKASPVTPEWLNERLRSSGALGHGKATRVDLQNSFGTTFADFDRLQVAYSGGTPDSAPGKLILKKPKDPLWGKLESTFYGEIAPATPGAAVPVCYDSALSVDGRRHCLLLQDAGESHDWGLRAYTEPPSAEASIKALGGLVDFHVRWWQDPRLVQADFLERRPGNLRMSQAATETIVRQNCAEFAERELPQFADRYGDQFRPQWRSTCERAIEAWERLFIERIRDGRGLTLIHADAHKLNLFVPRSATDRPLWLDWQTYCRGLGPQDVAYWLYVTQSPESRPKIEREVLRWYHDELGRRGVEGYTRDDCREDYRLAVIANLFPPLVWKNLNLLERAIRAFEDWDCHELAA